MKFLKFLKFLVLLVLAIISFYLWKLNENDQRLAESQYGDCINKCGNISVPYPFGIGPEHCYRDPYFEVTCIKFSSSSQIKPFLKILNYEIISISDFPDMAKGGSVTVQIPSLTVCSSNSSRATTNVILKSQNLAISSLKFSYSENVFVSVGCEGYAVLYNEAGRIIAACTSDCNPNPPAWVVRRCSGYHCCQDNLALETTQEYGVGVMVNNNTSGNCRSAFLISRQYLMNNAATLAPGTTAVHVVLEWPFYDLSQDYNGGFSIRDTLFPMAIALSVGIPLIICGCCWGLWQFQTKKRRKEIQLRRKYFKDNLNLQRSSTDDTNKTKLFTLAELKRCTDNFSKDRVLGQGGQGTVYKGMLMDGQVIAVKKSRVLDQSQWKSFINEIILLSEIKHKHVVRILGCCLEDDYPMVIYEFICNGNLSEHIKNSTEEFIFTWEMRLRIAYEVATAIAYLHSEFSTPIYHRDIKSSNVLLDDKFIAKLSDFGISKAVSLEQTHLTTCVRGTLGYLDPQYFYSSQYSEKSDVYSFGVILVELLTGQEPIRSQPLDDDDEESKDQEEEPSLVMYFTSSINDSTLLNIIDPIVLKSERIEEIMEFANLAKLCFNPRRLLRPSMKEVTLVLERLRCESFPNHMPLTPNNVQVNDWCDTSTEIDNAYMRSITHDHNPTEHLDSVDVEMRLLHTT